MNLSILIVTQGEPHSTRFILDAHRLANKLGDTELVLGLDKCQPEYWQLAHKTIQLKSAGYLESVLDDALAVCTGRWILRLDDDEKCSKEMERWLAGGKYQHFGDMYAFPRANMWNLDHFITTPPLWPDIQTRLSVREKAGGRNKIHQGSPHGPGIVAPVAIEHYKFLVRDYESRLKIATNYESVKAGCGFGETYQPHNLPEKSFKSMNFEKLKDGYFPHWQDISGKGKEVRFDS